MNATVDTLISLLRSAITGTNEPIDLADVDYEALFSLAKFHDLAHIVYAELNNRIEHWEGESCRRFKQQYDIAIYRCIKRDLAIAQLRQALESAGIPFVLLKGACLMQLYPEAWMRTSSDIDVLVRQADSQKAADTLQEAGFEKVLETAHDFSLYSPDKYHVELHYTLIEDNRLPNASAVLETVWENTEPAENRSEQMLNDAMFYFYHIAHMAKHFKDGGCGIRSFMDIWLLHHTVPFDAARRDEFLRDGGLLAFARQSENLAEQWFSNTAGGAESPDFAEFVINGGLYGSAEHNVLVRKQQASNRAAFYFRRFFPPYSRMKFGYPVLQKCPLLLPFCWVARWLKLLNPSTRKKALQEVKIESTTDDATGKNIETLMKDLELW